MSTLKTNNIQHVDRSDPSIIINTDGSVNIAGTMTYEDVTSVDAVGIITGREIINAQKQVHVGTGVSVKAGGIFVTAGISTFGGDIQAQGDVSIVDTIYHAGDTNTKIRFPSADTISFETGGTERLSIESDGTFAFGNVTPGGNPAGKNVFLCIGDSDSGIVQDGDGQIEIFANDAEVVNFNAIDGATFTGDIRIPDKIIHVGDTDTAIRFSGADTITAETAGAERFRIASDGQLKQTAASGSTIITFKRSDANTTGAVAVLNFAASDDHSVANIQAVGDGDNEGAHIIFKTTTAAASADPYNAATVERLRILSNGRVHIGNATNNAAAAVVFGVTADDGEAADLYVGQFKNLEATAGQSYGLNVQAGSNSTDHGFRVMNRANDTTQFLVRGDGKIGINENSPDQLLHIKDSNPFIEIEGTTNNSGDVGIFLNANGNHWLLRADNYPSANAFSIKDGDTSSSTHRLTVAAGTGNVTLNTGNLIIGTDGKGIDFSAQTATSESNASASHELLDHYEEGSWMPYWDSYGGSPNAGVFTYAANGRAGIYTRVGRIVHCSFFINWTAMSTVQTGTYAVISGLPFSVGTHTGGSHNGASEGSTMGVNWLYLRGNGVSGRVLTGFGHRGNSRIIMGYKSENGISAASPDSIHTSSTFSGGNYYIYGELSYITGT